MTQDAGESWHLKYHEDKGERPLLGFYMDSDGYGIAVGAFSKVLVTTDGGESWSARPLIEGSEDDFHLNDIFLDARSNVYIAAEFGTIYKSRDRGRTFSVVPTPYEGSFWSGLGLANGDVLIWGMRGNAYLTRDGGASWTKAETRTDRSISGGTQLSDGRIVAVGLAGVVLVSQDGGRSFTTRTRPRRDDYAAVAAGAAKNEILMFGVPGVETYDLTP